MVFLKKAQAALANPPGNYSRTSGPPSYIVVFDNIDEREDRKVKLRLKNQTVETEDYYLKLFHDAGLTMHKS